MTQTLLIFLHLIVLSIISGTNGFTMKMIPIESDELQILPNNLTTKERRLILANISISRAFSDQTNSSKLQPNSFTLPSYGIKKGYYVTSLEFGTGSGAFEGYFLIDTGSDNTWVQCEGCDPCFNLKDKYFRFTRSGSFQRIGVHDKLCDPPEDFAGSCKFENVYNPAHIQGFLGYDNFYFKNSVTKELDRFPGVAFGCGLINENFLFGNLYGRKNVVAGVYGLSPGPLSFLSQLEHYTKGRFSYCLVPVSLKGSSILNFGDDAQISGDDSRTVEVISMEPNAKKYHLFLNAISVDGNRLPIDPSVFELDKSDYSKGFLIDSGAPHTILVRSAYDPLRTAIIEYFWENYHMHPVDHGTSHDICYKWNPNAEINFPYVTFHFLLKSHQEEVDIVLGKDNLFEMYPKEQEFCFMIFAVDDSVLSLYGAYQQTNFKFLFDVNNWLLYFVPHVCIEG